MGNQTRGVYPADIIPFLATMGFYASVAILASQAKWDNDGLFAFEMVLFLLGGYTIVRWTSTWLSTPSLVTRQGTSFWIPQELRRVITDDLMDRALERFLDVVPRETFEVGRGQLEEMLKKTGIEWTLGPVSQHIYVRRQMEKEGVQFGHRIVVQWLGSVAASAFYHELLHEVNETIRLPQLKTQLERDNFVRQDRIHYDWEWWTIEAMLISDF